MGVPRLFRLLVERYPNILRDVNPDAIPPFDNFYLDFNGLRDQCSHTSSSFSPRICCMFMSTLIAFSLMTGIVHACTHNNDDSIIRTEQVFLSFDLLPMRQAL